MAPSYIRFIRAIFQSVFPFKCRSRNVAAVSRGSELRPFQDSL
jgi:hypothetical protein